MSSNTPYRGLVDSSNFPRGQDDGKQNFEAFKQQKFKEIDQARGMRESVDQRKKSILKPTTLNLRNLTPVEQGPPTFDSQYQFRNLLITDYSKASKSDQMQINLRLNSMTKQYETKIKAQADRYELEILKLNQKIESIRQNVSHNQTFERRSVEVEYCHLCSNGQVINGMNKMMKGLEEAHQNCMVQENQASKRIIALEKQLADSKESVNSLMADKSILTAKVNAYEEEMKILNHQLSQERQATKRYELDAEKAHMQSQQQYQSQSQNQNHMSLNFEKQRVNPRIINMPNPYERASINIKSRPSSSSLLDPTNTKRSSTPGLFYEEFKNRRPTIAETYQSQHASKIIDRVKSNSVMGGGIINPRTKALQQKKYNYA